MDMTQEQLDEILRLHKLWLNGDPKGQRANLRRADLRWANLQGANLRWANLQGANLDFSCWPLWCGSLGVKLDDRQLRQLCYHFVDALISNPETGIKLQETTLNDLKIISSMSHIVETHGKRRL